MRPGHSLPLLGTWLYHRQVQALARSVITGNIAAISTLAAIIASTDNLKARLYAENCLRSLTTRHQIDLLCREVLAQDSTALTTLVQECGYLPSNPADRALFLFCASCRDLPEIPGEEYPELSLARGYLKADTSIRARARDTARRNNTCHILARAICSSGMPGPIERSYDEWEIVIAGLTRANRWEDLWHQALFAPIPLAVTAITTLKSAGWTPTGDDQRIWNGIIETLPAAWTYPSPSEGSCPTIGRRLRFPGWHFLRMDHSLQRDAVMVRFRSGTRSHQVLPVRSPLPDPDMRISSCCPEITGTSSPVGRGAVFNAMTYRDPP